MCYPVRSLHKNTFHQLKDELIQEMFTSWQLQLSGRETDRQMPELIISFCGGGDDDRGSMSQKSHNDSSLAAAIALSSLSSFPYPLCPSASLSPPPSPLSPPPFLFYLFLYFSVLLQCSGQNNAVCKPTTRCQYARVDLCSNRAAILLWCILTNIKN